LHLFAFTGDILAIYYRVATWLRTLRLPGHGCISLQRHRFYQIFVARDVSLWTE